MKPSRYTVHRVTVSLTLALALAVFAGPAALAAEVVESRIGTQYQNVRLLRVVDGLHHPWAIAWLPDESMLVTERRGRLQLVRDGEKTEIAGVPEVSARRQGGLLDVVVHPDFEENQYVYLTYSRGDGDGNTATALARGRLEDDELTDVEDIFIQDRYSSPGRHYGSRLAFTDDGYLLMSIGDRGADPPRAQDLGDHAGTLLRLNDDGTPAADNPFIDDDDVHDEIYSYGHRNIQGMTLDPDTGDIWVTDHGPRGGDRLDRIQRGGNYGWPTVSFGRDYGTQEQWGEGRVAPGIIPPVHEFLPTLAPSGLAWVDSEHFEPWQGDLLAGGLRGQVIQRLVVEEGVLRYDEASTEPLAEGAYVAHAEALLHETLGRIRDVRLGPDGYIYIAVDSDDASVYRLEPAG